MVMQYVSDTQLVAWARTGDLAAFEVLWQRHEARLYRLVLGITRNPEDAADALQETLLKIYRHLSAHRGEAQFSSWAYRVAVNAAHDVLRRRGKQERILLALAPRAAVDRPYMPLPDEMAESRERAEALYRAISLLRPWMRRVIALSDLHGWSCRRVSQTLGVPEGTVKSRLHRARRELASRLQPTLQARTTRGRTHIPAAVGGAPGTTGADVGVHG